MTEGISKTTAAIASIVHRICTTEFSPDGICKKYSCKIELFIYFGNCSTLRSALQKQLSFKISSEQNETGLAK